MTPALPVFARRLARLVLLAPVLCGCWCNCGSDQQQHVDTTVIVQVYPSDLAAALDPSVCRHGPEVVKIYSCDLPARVDTGETADTAVPLPDLVPMTCSVQLVRQSPTCANRH